MAQRSCKHCNYPYIKNNYCPNCGSDKPLDSNDGCSSLVGLVVVVLIVFVIFKSNNTNDNDGQKIDQTVIDTFAVAVDTTALAVDSVSAPIDEEKAIVKTIDFFNNTNEAIFVAVAFFNNESGWESQGWYTINPNDSKTINLPNSFSDDSIYWYAKNDSGLTWTVLDETYKTFCVDETLKFDYIGSDSQNCSYTSVMKSFNRLELNGSYTKYKLN
jgi:uncharacterized membrane protein